MPAEEPASYFGHLQIYVSLFSQDLDAALPIIEKYKDQLLAIGEVNPFDGHLKSNSALRGMYVIILGPSLVTLRDSYVHLCVQPASNLILPQ